MLLEVWQSLVPVRLKSVRILTVNFNNSKMVKEPLHHGRDYGTRPSIRVIEGKVVVLKMKLIHGFIYGVLGISIGFLYWPVLDYLRLRALGHIDQSGLWRCFNPLFRFKYYKELVFGADG